MGNKIDNGGPAYPRTGYYPPTTPGMGIDSLRERLDVTTDPQDGMTLRDYFAAAALTGEIASYSTEESCAASAAAAKSAGRGPAEHIAVLCYRIADAMLAERSK